MSGRPIEPLRRALQGRGDVVLGSADDADRARDRTERLVVITSAIADAVTAMQVFAAVVDETAAAVGAESAALWTSQGGELFAALVRSVGYSEASQAAFARLSLEVTGRVPAADVVMLGEPLYIASKEELLERYPHLGVNVRDGSYRVACLPIAVNGKVIGAIGFTFAGAAPFDEDERAFYRVVARHCGQALERLRLLEAEQQHRARAETSAARMGVLNRASRICAESTASVPDVMQALADQLTGECVDTCVVFLVHRNGVDMRRVAVSHRSAASDTLGSLMDASVKQVGEGFAGRVAQTGNPVFIPQVDSAELLQRTAPAMHDWLKRHMPNSLVVMPLRARGMTLGSVIATREDGSPPLTEEDVALIEELAERAAMAVDRGRLDEDTRRAKIHAETLLHLARAVIESERIEDVFVATLDTIERSLHTPRASILLFDDGGVMRFRAWRGISERYRGSVEGHSPWTGQPRESRPTDPIVVPDVTQDRELSSHLSVFLDEGIRALVFIPLIAGGRVIGKFMVYYGEPTVVEAHDLELARGLANHVASAVVQFAAMEELKSTVRFNEMFTAVLGHDLRNPLGGIMAAAQLAMRRNEEDKLTKPLARIVNSADRMARMIDQLLDFTRVRVGGGIPLKPSPVDLRTLVAQVIEELTDAYPTWSFHVEKKGDATGSWDPDRLAQVFSNLIGNAVQHGDPAGGVLIRIEGTEPSLVVIEVHNMGTVPEDLLPKLFEPMTGGVHRREKSVGLGLGLFITRQITAAHGGEIAVRSTPESGTTFSVTLPRGRASFLRSQAR